MRRSEYRKMLQRQEQRIAAKKAKEEEKFDFWKAAKAAKKWVLFFLVHAVLTSGKK